MPDERKIAGWKPVRGGLQDRQYKRRDGTFFSPDITGQRLPAHREVDRLNAQASGEKALAPQLQQVAVAKIQSLVESARLFTNLPADFLNQLLSVQLSGDYIRFPTMGQNKNQTVEACIKGAKPEIQVKFALERWKELGWPSQDAYEKWLQLPMLVAFSGCAHYCTAPRVFEDVSTEAGTVFQQIELHAEKTTNILSVAGFEFRGYRGAIEDTYPLVAEHSAFTMSQILEAAVETQTQHVVLIPFGMGVFLPSDRTQAQKIKEKIVDGWRTALRAYQKPQPSMTIHCCMPDDIYQTLQIALLDIEASAIVLENRTGLDAYAVANALQDKGEKSLLVNAGDHDWIVALHPNNTPGQCGRGHTLFHSTSDEYFSLMTLFSLFSLENMRKYMKNFVQCIHSPFPTKAPTSAPKGVDQAADQSKPEPLSQDMLDMLKTLRQTNTEIATILKMLADDHERYPEVKAQIENFQNYLQELKKHLSDATKLSQAQRVITSFKTAMQDEKYRTALGSVFHKLFTLLDKLLDLIKRFINFLLGVEHPKAAPRPYSGALKLGMFYQDLKVPVLPQPQDDGSPQPDQDQGEQPGTSGQPKNA